MLWRRGHDRNLDVMGTWSLLETWMLWGRGHIGNLDVMETWS